MRITRGAVFAAISVTVHAALLTMTTGAGHRVETPPRVALDVSLDTESHTPPDTTVRQRESRDPPRRKHDAPALSSSPPVPAEPIEPARETQPGLALETSAPPELSDAGAPRDSSETVSTSTDDPAPEIAPSSSAASEPRVTFALVMSYLRDAIERSKVYPLLARQRGWEGEVLLAFRVVDDGAIRSVYVARSSGNRLLDQSAVQALRHVERITPELWRHGDNAELQLSVVYRLIKS